MASRNSEAVMGPEAPAAKAVAITPHDSNALAFITRGLYVGVSGDVKVRMVDGSDVTFVGLAAGIIHPIQAQIVFSTGTTATSIVGVA